MMVRDNQASLGTAFTVSIDAARRRPLRARSRDDDPRGRRR
jgi:hypothetical protein